MSMDASQAARVVALGRLGVWLMIGLLVFTAVRPFDSLDWLIDNDVTNDALTVLTSLFFVWAMPLLFVLAGTAAWFAGMARDGRRFAGERTRRLLVPFAAGALLLAPFQAWVISWHNGFYSGRFTEYLPIWIDSLTIESSPAVLRGHGGHLWFLAYLLIFGLMSWPLQTWMRGAGARAVRLLAESVAHHRGSIVLGVVPLVVVREALHGFSPEEHGWTDFAYLAIFFLYGLLLLQDPRFTMVVRRDWRFSAVTAAFGVLVIAVGAWVGLISADSWVPVDGPDLGSVVLNLAVPLAACGGGLTVLAGALTWLTRPTQSLRYGQSVILAFYVMYLPVVVSVAAYVVTTGLGFWARVGSTVLVSLAVSLLLVEIIRRVPLLRRLMSVTPYVSDSPTVSVAGAKVPVKAGR